MYECCREAYRVKGKGQRARGSTYETGIHIYSFNGRIFFCIMQSARGALIASTSSEISRVISLTKGRKVKEEGEWGRKKGEKTFLPCRGKQSDSSKHENRGGHRVYRKRCY